MTLWTHSVDGITPGVTRGSLPSRFTRRLDTGAWSIPTVDTAEAFGWYPVTVTDRPDHDPWDSVTREVVHDGAGFVTTWTVTPGTPPLVPDADRIDDDHVQAALMLLSEDAALAAVLLARLADAAGVDVAEARAEARAAMAALAADPALRDELIAARLRGD